MHSDSTWLDAQLGMSIDDPHSVTAGVGRWWQTASGRSPRQLVEQFRLHNVHNTTQGDLLDGRWATWRGGRAYVPPSPPANDVLYL